MVAQENARNRKSWKIGFWIFEFQRYEETISLGWTWWILPDFHSSWDLGFLSELWFKTASGCAVRAHWRDIKCEETSWLGRIRARVTFLKMLGTDNEKKIGVVRWSSSKVIRIGCASAILMAKRIPKPKAINLGLFLKVEFMICNWFSCIFLTHDRGDMASCRCVAFEVWKHLQSVPQNKVPLSSVTTPKARWFDGLMAWWFDGYVLVERYAM